MPTTSTVPAFKRKLVELLDAALPGTQVAYRWPGPSTEDRGVYLRDVEGSQDFTALTAHTARTRRQERYEVELVCATWRDGLDPDDGDDAGPAAAEQAAFDLLAEVENVLNAAATRAALQAVTGLSSWALIRSFASELVVHESGWRAAVTTRIEVTARLT